MRKPASPAACQNIHIYPSDFSHASRIMRIARTLTANRITASICLVGIQKGAAPEKENVNAKIRIWRVPVNKYRIQNRKINRILRYTNWLSRIYAEFSGQQIRMVNCHSIYDLPAGVLLKWKTRCILVYDTHELETERNELKGLLKIVFKITEKLLVPFCDQIFTVSDSIRDWYKSRFPRKRVQTILNIPPDNAHPTEPSIVSLRSRFAIPDNDLIFLYLGLLKNGRGLDLMLRVFSSGPASRHLVMIGYGPLAEPIRSRIQACPNIHLMGAVPSDMVQAYAAAADVGLVLIERTCLSYYYCLPNKLFENYRAGIPCIVSNFPELSRFVKKYKCGWKTEVSEDAFSRLVKGLSREKIETMRGSMSSIADPPRWEHEEKKLLAAYAGLLEKENGCRK
jgi:glycosyltransferase involved in cell wall biosynthesis